MAILFIYCRDRLCGKLHGIAIWSL